MASAHATSPRYQDLLSAAEYAIASVWDGTEEHMYALMTHFDAPTVHRACKESK